jgi:hypothetical protein
MRWVDHVAHMGKMGNVYRILVEKCRRYDLKGLGTDGKIIFEWLLAE